MEDDYQKGECTKCTKHIHDTNYGYVNGLLYVLGFSFFLGGGGGLVPNCLLSVVLWGLTCFGSCHTEFTAFFTLIFHLAIRSCVCVCE